MPLTSTAVAFAAGLEPGEHIDERHTVPLRDAHQAEVRRVVVARALEQVRAHRPRHLHQRVEPSATPRAPSDPDRLDLPRPAVLPQRRADTRCERTRAEFGVIRRPCSSRDRSVISRASRPGPPNFTPYGWITPSARESGSVPMRVPAAAPSAQGCCAAEAIETAAPQQAGGRRHDLRDRATARGLRQTARFAASQLPDEAGSNDEIVRPAD